MTIKDIEQTKVGKTRNVAMDLGAIIHMTEAMKKEGVWSCECECCAYVRKDPRIVESFTKAILKNF
jgi:hypothetical protein